MTWVAGPDGDRVSPLAWSMPYLRVAGIRLRLHWIFLAYAAVVMLRSTFAQGVTDATGNAPAAPAVTGIALVGLLAIVTARELVRALVVRSSGGSADEVPLWPLGALEGLHPAQGWRCAMAAALAGPCVSVVLFALLAVPIGLATGEWMGGAFPHPLDDGWLRNQHPRWVEVAWVVHRTNVQIALLNMLPMVPLDLGLVIGALVLRSQGKVHAPRLIAKISLWSAVLVAIPALALNLGTMLAVAVGCLALAALMLRRIQLGDAVHSASSWMRTDAGADRDMDEDASERRLRREQERAIEREQEALERQALLAAEEGRELDRILEKIATHGLDSLTPAEHQALHRATERRRRDGEPPKTR